MIEIPYIKIINSRLNKFVNYKGFWGQVLIDEFIDKTIESNYDSFQKVIKQITSKLDSVNDSKTALNKLPSIYDDIKDDELYEGFINSCFLSDLTGRLSFQSEIEYQSEIFARHNGFWNQSKSELDLIKSLKLCFDKPPEEAVKVLKNKEIYPSWSWTEQRNIIAKNGFTVAKTTTADIVDTFYTEIKKSMDEGLPFNQFKKNINPILQDKGYIKRADGTTWRLDTIYRTNMSSAYQDGRWKEMMAVKDTFPYWEFVAILDIRTTPNCRSVDGVILPVDDEFWKRGNYPPRHFNCRSHIRALSDKTLGNNKLSNSSSFKDITGAEGFDVTPYTPEKKTDYPPELQKKYNEKSYRSDKDIVPEYTEGLIKRLDVELEEHVKKSEELWKELRKEREEYLHVVPEKTKSSILTYSGKDYEKINESLRVGKPDIHAKNMIEEDLNYKLKKDLTLFRGSGKLAENIIESVPEIGADFTNQGFFSSSVDPDIARFFAKKKNENIIFKINVKAGTNVGFGNALENEIILNHNSKFKINDKKLLLSNKNRLLKTLIVEMDVIND